MEGVIEMQDTETRAIELLAKLHHALYQAMDGCDALTSDDEELTHWVNISRQIAAKIAPMRPLTSRDWAFKLSIDSEDYMIGAPVMESIINDVKRELSR